MTAYASELVEQGFELIETHISQVFVRGIEVYKLKRPLALPFLDYSMLALRERACRAELVLNRRLAPDVYLGLAALVRDEQGRRKFVNAEQVPRARVEEWAVHMRRLDDADRADVLLARAELSAEQLAALAVQIARFHARAAVDPEGAEFGSPEAIARLVEENLQETAVTSLQYIDAEERIALASFQLGFVAREHELLRTRAREQRIREGHGDLRLEHCYRSEHGFLIIDCIEFNARLRFGDVAADVAFLAMDLAHQGRVDLSERFIAAYARESGDYGVYSVLDFYQSYRAVVRAKVSSLLAADADVTAASRERGRHEARSYYLLALAASARAAEPQRLIVTFGLIASGKSSLAEGIGARLAIPVLSADSTRKELLGVAPTSPHHDAPFEGAYSKTMTERVYARMFRRASQVLRSGRSVVIDASFGARAHREQVRVLAELTRSEIVFLECRCDRKQAMERLERRAQGASISDGRAEIYDDFAAHFEPPDELFESEHRRIDTSGPVEKTLEDAIARI